MMTAIGKNRLDAAHTVSGNEVFEQVMALSSQGIKLLLENMFKKTALLEEQDLSSKDSQRLIDLIDNEKNTILSAFIFQLQERFSDFKSFRKTRLNDNTANVRAETEELESITTRIEAIYSDRYQPMVIRLGSCINRSRPEACDSPLHIKSLLQCFQYAIDSLGLSTDNKIALYQLLTHTVIDQLDPLYKTIEQCFIEYNIMPDLKLMPSESPVKKSSNQPAKPDESVAMSHIPVLMGLFLSFKEKSNFSDGNYDNLFQELKQKLNERDITDFNPLIDQLFTKFEMFFSDEDLPERIKEQIARLQIYLFSSAIQEKGLLKRSSNPARRLLDTVIRTEVDLAIDDQEDKSGYEFLRDQIDQLGHNPFIESSTYAELLEGYQAHIQEKAGTKAELVEIAPIETKAEKSVEAAESEVIEDVVVEDSVTEDTVVEDSFVENSVEEDSVEEAPVQESVIEDAFAELKVAEPENETPATAAETTKPATIEPLPDVKPVSMAEAMVRSISQSIEILRPKLVKTTKPVEPEKTETPEVVTNAVEEVAIVEAVDEPKKAIATEQSVANEKTETTQKDGSDNIYPVVQSIVNDMTLPLRVQGKSLILFDEVWAPLLLKVARTKGFKSPVWQKTLTIAKTQVWALTPKTTEQQLERLMSTLGHMEKSLSQSMQSLKLPFDQVASLLEFFEHEQVEIVEQSKANIEQIKKAEKPNKPDTKQQQANAEPTQTPDKKSDKVDLADTIDEFSTLMETGRFEKSNDMLKALNADKTKQKDQEPVSADNIHKSDWVEIKKGSSTVLAKLTWRAEDRSQFIFVDREGNRVCEIDKDNLNKELKAGTISLISSTPISSQRPAYSLIQTIK